MPPTDEDFALWQNEQKAQKATIDSLTTQLSDLLAQLTAAKGEGASKAELAVIQAELSATKTELAEAKTGLAALTPPKPPAVVPPPNPAVDGPPEAKTKRGNRAPSGWV